MAEKFINTLINTLFTGDNLRILNGMNSASADLIYPDPPFNSKRTCPAPAGGQSAGSSFKDILNMRIKQLRGKCLSVTKC